MNDVINLHYCGLIVMTLMKFMVTFINISLPTDLIFQSRLLVKQFLQLEWPYRSRGVCRRTSADQSYECTEAIRRQGIATMQVSDAAVGFQ